MSMEAALATYVAESRELLEEMESCLFALEDGGWSDEQLQAIFRAAHTIKGSAGLFGLDEVVRFTHEVESVLDRVRCGDLALHDDLLSVLFECQSHMGHQIDELEQGVEQPGLSIRSGADELIARLRTLAGDNGQSMPERAAGDATWTDPEGPDPGDDDPAAVADHWHISLRFHRDCLRDGMDPMSFLRYLETMGRIVAIVTLENELPELDALDPESCHLGFEIGFLSEADKQSIEDVFEFVREDSLVRIVPPHGRISEYIGLLESLPEDDLKLGEMLVRCRSLTETELRKALATQEHLAGRDQARPLGEILVESGSAEPAVVEAAIRKQDKGETDAATRQQSTIRVDAERLDSLVNLIGELVTAGASTSLHAQQTSNTALKESLAGLTELVEEVRDAALQLRMVQIGATFNRFRRVVRDVSRELSKRIELEITGADTELDKTVVERIGDPLMHLVRNAIDHGIEPPEERLAAGKPEAGHLRLHAFHDSGAIVIEIRDDGRGMDADRIRARAEEKGVIAAGQELSEQEIHELIFEPGLSTAEKVSDLSGRGVGMDVVRSNIQELGGRVRIDSRKGVGTTLQVHLPLTLAIIDGFLVTVGDSSFVVPLESVLECMELTMADATERNGRQYMDLRGEVLPFIRLRDLFGLKACETRRENVVVVRYGEQKAGLVVDALHGELQTVIKPLGPLFSSLRGISGSTVMGDGSVALIIDVPTLVHRVTQQESQSTAGVR